MFYEVAFTGAIRYELECFLEIVLNHTNVQISQKIYPLFTFLSHQHRCHKTLFMFHNGRAAVSLILLAANSLEFARTLLPHHSAPQLNLLFDSTPREQNFLIVIGSGEIWNAILSTLLTLMLMLYHRIVERKKATGGCLFCCRTPCAFFHLKFACFSVFLYASTAVEVLTFVLRTNELSELVYYEDLWELQTCLVGISATCMLVLASLDGYTIYKEVSESVF